MSVPSDLLQTVASTVDRYSLLGAGEDTVVAFSGGKDSIATCLCLSKLGYGVRPVAVDMGYEEGWADRIQALGESLALAVEIIKVRVKNQALMPSTDHHKIQLRLEVLNSINAAGSSATTPCTHCYNSKVIALDNVARQRVRSKIVFGHHLTDACSSLVKEGLLRIDRIDRGHVNYSRANFETLVEQLSAEARACRAEPAPLFDRIAQLVGEGRVDTDEPPRQPLRLDRPGVDLIRPMFDVWEDALTSLSADLGITPEGSGCGHGATANTETPREMVHYRVLRQARPGFRDSLAALVKSNVTNAGLAKTRSRYRRIDDLGANYKRSPPVSDKL
jgi:tRNA(Ile)-lysidine synthase TilS/MesJ